MAKKKAGDFSSEIKRSWIEENHPELSLRQQCALAGLGRSSYYQEPVRGEDPYNLKLMRVIDEQYLHTPFYGVPKMTVWLQGQGHGVNHKRVERLMGIMGLQSVLPGPQTSRKHPAHRIYPYLLKGKILQRVNEAWASDITYVPMQNGYMYLVAVIDWYSRYVLAWEVSNTLETDFCMVALESALSQGVPEIFNTDQGAQFTSQQFTGRLETAGIRVSMDGRGRAVDNIYTERLWWSVKYENIYLRDYADGQALREGLKKYFRYYNTERMHQALGYQTPAAVHAA